MEELRWEPRRPRSGYYAITWRGANSNAYSTEGSGIDISESGIGLESPVELKIGSIVFVQARDGSVESYCEVVHCTHRGTQYHVGLEIRDAHEEEPAAPPPMETKESEADHYEVLQISPKADLQTVHRVFRIMAARFHPDNPETGDVEQFLRMKKAYSVLSDPERRQEYDATLKLDREHGPRPIFGLKDFVAGVEAEGNRRLGVLCLLYTKRQTNPDAPGVSLLDLEKEMGFPREYLSFTIWYLRSKDLITIADNSDYALTAIGADFVEKKAIRHEIVAKLLNPPLQEQRPASPKRRTRTPAAPVRRKLIGGSARAS